MKQLIQVISAQASSLQFLAAFCKLKELQNIFGNSIECGIIS
jgi:hypothetical protein